MSGPISVQVIREYLEVHFKKSIKEKGNDIFSFISEKTATIKIYLLGKREL